VRRNDDDRPTTHVPPGLMKRAAERAAKRMAPMGRVQIPGGIPPHVAEGVAWAQFLDENKDRFQRTLDVPMGGRLGCGRFGCVYESSAPWVVKITRDDSEGPIWSYMAELLADEELVGMLPSYLRVHDVVRIQPDVIFNDESQPVFGIVREEAAPVFIEVPFTNPRDKYDVTYEIALSPQTLSILGVTPATLKRVKMETPILYKHMSEKIALFPKGVQQHFAHLHMAAQGTRGYRKAADVFHRLRWKADKTEREEELAEEALQDMLAACTLMQRLSLSEELGTTLIASQVEADLVFRDLHVFNIGWRTHRSIEGEKLPQCMVILDPGAMNTPYMPEIREVTLLRNAGTYLRNAGLLGQPEVTDATPRAFKEAFDLAMYGNPYSAFVSHYSLEELDGMRALYLSSDGSAGIAAHDHGDGRIEGTALFSAGGGMGQVLLRHAIRRAGVNYLECFGEGLRILYEHNGFNVESESPFDERYAPRDWNYARFGRPTYYTLRRVDMDLEKNPRTAKAREEAMDEMIANPSGVRDEVVRILRRDGLSEAQIEWELGMIGTTLGF